jgi:hypothetical protein
MAHFNIIKYISAFLEKYDMIIKHIRIYLGVITVIHFRTKIETCNIHRQLWLPFLSSLYDLYKDVVVVFFSS